MVNPLRDLGVSDADLTAAIEKSAEVKVEQRRVAKEMVAYAKSIAPVETGEYAAKIKSGESKKTGRVWVGATARHSHLVEYGTDTTPEHAVMAKTAAAFGGTSEGHGVEIVPG